MAHVDLREQFVASCSPQFVSYLQKQKIPDGFDPYSAENRAILQDIEANRKNMVKCTHCKKVHEQKLNKCSACKMAAYCDQECQKKDWKEHKQICADLKAILAVIKS